MSDSDGTASVPHVVYRCFSASGTLLYVGCTRNWKRRQTDHRHSTAFWSEVAYTTTEEHPTRAAGLLAEAAAIRDEEPIHNKAPGTPGALDTPESRAAYERLTWLSGEMRRCHNERDAMIVELRATGEWSLQRLADAAGVPKATMQSIVNRLERS